MFENVTLPSKKILLAALAGLFAGLLLLVVFRFVAIAAPTHYHANMHLYVNGERETFDSFTYYEEVEACSADPFNNPKSRVHLHQPDSDVIHVHEKGVTWAMLFANLDLALTDNLVQTENGVFVDGDDDKQLTFLLNGQKETILAGKVIGDEDVLLISYGDGNIDVQAQYDAIDTNAARFNETKDPAACSGRDTEKFSERLKYALFGLTIFE